MYRLAIKDYIIEKGHASKEKNYQEMKEEKRKKATKKDVETVAKQSSIKGLQSVKDFFTSLFSRKEKTNER